MRVSGPALVAVLLCSASLSGCVSTIGGSAAPAPGPKSTPGESTAKPVRGVDLPALLLSATEIDTIMKTTGMKVENNYDQPTVSYPDHPSSNPRCVGAVLPDAAETYKGSGYLKAVGQDVNTSGDEKVRRSVLQWTTLYSSEERAHTFVENSRQQWSDCAGQNLTYTYEDKTTADWTIGTPTNSDDVISVLDFQEGAEGWACARSMTSRSNVVIDVAACGRDVNADRSVALAVKIRDKIPA
jgi:serine/threonine-protein kinase